MDHKPRQYVGDGLCACGCGGATSRWKYTLIKIGVKRGDFRVFIKGHTNKVSDLSTRYVVDQYSGCWEWTGHIANSGYGRLGRKWAHRVSYESSGLVIPDGKQLDHLCRNRKCINPTHLEPVSPATNSRRGELTRLTAADVLEIRASAGRGASNASIARRFGVSDRHVGHIVLGQKWRDGV